MGNLAVTLSALGLSGVLLYEMTNYYTHPLTPYGLLVDVDTGERLRPATRQERDRAALCAQRFPRNCGTIWVGERRCSIDPGT